MIDDIKASVGLCSQYNGQLKAKGTFGGMSGSVWDEALEQVKLCASANKGKPEEEWQCVTIPVPERWRSEQTRTTIPRGGGKPKTIRLTPNRFRSDQVQNCLGAKVRKESKGRVRIGTHLTEDDLAVVVFPFQTEG